MRGLLDTSIVVATDAGDLPDEAAISVVTLAELHYGVHVAPSPEARALRGARLAEVEALFDALPVDDAVARSYGLLAFHAARRGARPRARVRDLLLAATALAHHLPLYTRDADFPTFAPLVDVHTV